jgi:hypothetical protein
VFNSCEDYSAKQTHPKIGNYYSISNESLRTKRQSLKIHGMTQASRGRVDPKSILIQKRDCGGGIGQGEGTDL